jgi:hypothetical protein
MLLTDNNNCNLLSSYKAITRRKLPQVGLGSLETALANSFHTW